MDLSLYKNKELVNSESWSSLPNRKFELEYYKLKEMKKAFRKRKQIIENITNETIKSLKNEVEEEPSHHWLPCYSRTNDSLELETPKRDFLPATRPKINKLSN